MNFAQILWQIINDSYKKPRKQKFPNNSVCRPNIALFKTSFVAKNHYFTAHQTSNKCPIKSCEKKRSIYNLISSLRQVERAKKCDAKYKKNLKTFAFVASRQKRQGVVFVERVISSQFWPENTLRYLREKAYIVV